MNFSNYRQGAVNFSLFLFLNIRCFGGESNIDTSTQTDVVVRMLPINERVLKFNTVEVGAGTLPTGYDRKLFEAMKKQGLSVAQQNGITLNPFGHFILSLNQSVIGFSFEPADGNFRAESPAGLVHSSPVMIDNSPDDSWRPNEGWANLPENKFVINDIAALKEFTSIEYINFGVADFSAGIWESLQKVAETTHLRGLVVYRTKSILRVRADQSLPQIRGIVIHVNSLDDVVEAGKAFPEVTYLCLGVSNRELLRDVLIKNLLNRSFSKLQAVEIVSTYSATWDEWLRVTAADDKFIRFHTSRVPVLLEWLCVDGLLLSKNEMLNYDNFSIHLRFRLPVELNRLRENRKVAVVFSGMGFAGGGARALDIFERNKTEIYWR